MKKIVCRRKEFFLVGIIVFLMLMMSSCSSNESNYSETGDDTHRGEQTGITTALTGIINALPEESPQEIPLSTVLNTTATSVPWLTTNPYGEQARRRLGLLGSRRRSVLHVW